VKGHGIVRPMSSIRLIAPAERGLLAPLLEELLAHYSMPAPDRERIRAALVEQPPGVEMLVAFDAAETPISFASFAQIFPGLATAPQFYMKELYVAASHRGTGLGEAMMRELAKIAHARGCTRVDWTTQVDNVGARAFYERIGARVVEEKVYFRLDAEGIAALTRG
jgi:ribosomal protein S18 acetylase RimI-like enzyme